MASAHPTPVYRRFRLLRSESLERRELLAFTPFGGGLLAAFRLAAPLHNAAGLFHDLVQETTPGMKNPWTGQDLSGDSHPGSGLPGGPDIGQEFPSGQQWIDRLNGFLSGGSDYLGEGTPFEDTPGSDPADDFLSQHGANIPDPFAGFGNSRPGFSPAEDDSGSGSVTVGEITVEPGSTDIVCASDFLGAEDLGKGGDECVVIQRDGQGNYKTDADKALNDYFWNKWVPKGEDDQQYEGEGGYTGGDGHCAGDLYLGYNARMTGKVVGGHDPDGPGLGQDTGRQMPAFLEAIEKYFAQGGSVHCGTAGYQGGDSGFGHDTGGAAEDKVSGLKQAIDAQRFVADPNAPNPEEVPWWIEEVVSPMG
jgi:hypothetical protein